MSGGDDATRPPAEPRKSTGIVKVEAEAEVERERIKAEVERERIQAEKEAKLAELHAREHTSLGEALTAARPIILGVAALAVLALAVYLGRGLQLFGLGSTGGEHADSPPGVAPQRPEDDSPPVPEVP